MITAVALFGLAGAWPPAARAAQHEVSGGSKVLRETIARAHSGDTIVVSPGVYRVNLVLKKPVTLVGQTGAILDGGGHGNVVKIIAPHVTLRGFEIRDSGRNLTKMNAGIFVAGSAKAAVIENNLLVDDLFGLWLDGSPGTQVLRNHVRGISELRSQDRGDGIHLWNNTGVLVQGNDIEGTRDGIYIYGSDHNTLTQNTMHNLRYGIHYMFSNHNLVTDNSTYHTHSGYALMQSDHLTVTGNHSRHDESYGILMNFVTYSTIAHNVIIGVGSELGYMSGGTAVLGGSGKAIFVYNSVYNDIDGNLLADSPIGIHMTAGSEDNHIHGNAFVHNRIQVEYAERRAQEWSVAGRGNYWSDYLGWDLNDDGVGDRPYRPNSAVDILFWEYPTARLLMTSPAVALLRYVQDQFPVFQPPAVQDSHPLMTSPIPIPANQ